MENLQNIMLYLNGIKAQCVEIHTMWTEVLGAEMIGELDGEGVLAATVSRIENHCSVACEQICQSCGMQAAPAEPVESIDLHLYHTAEFFQGEVYDGEGNVVDIEAFYCDQYKLNKMISKSFSEGADNVLAQAQEIVAFYQAGVETWSAEVGDMVLETVQPVLDEITSLYELCGQIAQWHIGEADRNMSLFQAG